MGEKKKCLYTNVLIVTDTILVKIETTGFKFKFYVH